MGMLLSNDYNIIHEMTSFLVLIRIDIYCLDDLCYILDKYTVLCFVLLIVTF